MDRTVFISLPIEDLESVIIDCVNSCLRNHKQQDLKEVYLDKDLLTIQEASELLHLTVPTLYSKNSKGEIPGVCKQGKRLYFSKQSLIDWIKEGKQMSNDEIEAQADSFLKRKGGKR